MTKKKDLEQKIFKITNGMEETHWGKKKKKLTKKKKKTATNHISIININLYLNISDTQLIFISTYN